MVQETLFAKRTGGSSGKVSRLGFRIPRGFIGSGPACPTVLFPNGGEVTFPYPVVFEHPYQPGAFHPTGQPDLLAAAFPDREVGGTMLGIKGTIRLWYVSGITDMRFGKYRLFSEVEALGRNPYNGDGYLFLSKDRRTVKSVRYRDQKRYLYDITHDHHKFMKPVIENDEIIYELQYIHKGCSDRERVSAGEDDT